MAQNGDHVYNNTKCVNITFNYCLCERDGFQLHARFPSKS
jgi:hypothetical protein